MRASTMTAANLRPPRTVVLPASAFRTTYKQRPDSDIAVGVVVLGEESILAVTSGAWKEAAKTVDVPDEITQHLYNEWVMLLTCGLATTDPNDANRNHFEYGGDEVQRALTPAGLSYLYSEIEAASITASPTRPEASEDDLNDLSFWLADPGALSRLSVGQRLRVSRLLRFCLDEIRESQPEPVDDDT